MSNLPLISVIVPVYNTEAYLRKCLDSICEQTYPHLEILCVNDGSTDGSEWLKPDLKAFFSCKLKDNNKEYGIFAKWFHGIR